MYGKNNPSPKKRLIILEGLKMGKNFSDLAADLSITKATAEVYGIDGLAAGQQIDHETLARLLDVSMDCFKRIRNKIVVCEDRKLRTICDNRDLTIRQRRRRRGTFLLPVTYCA